jgi:hypothetical protein
VKTITFKGTAYNCPFLDMVPRPTAEERRELYDDVGARGHVIVPVIIDEDNNVLDGHTRLEIAAELHLPDVPFQIKVGLTWEQKEQTAWDLNAHRRHLTREQKRERVERLLRQDPAVSDRQIAAAAGVDHKTAGVVRDRLETTGEIPQLVTRTGKDDKVRKRLVKKKQDRKQSPPILAFSQHEEVTQPDSVPAAAEAAESVPPLAVAPKSWRSLLRDNSFSAGRVVVELKRLSNVPVQSRDPAEVLRLTKRLRAVADAIEQGILGNGREATA